MVRPHLQLTFENILAHINTIYVLKTRQGAMGRHQRNLRLKVCITIFLLFCIPIIIHSRKLKKGIRSTCKTNPSQTSCRSCFFLISLAFQMYCISLYYFICFQGQMLYIAESDLILFQCYPSVMNLDDLTK